MTMTPVCPHSNENSCSPTKCIFPLFSDWYLIYISYSIKPTLKKVSKYENKFAKLQKKAAEFNFRNQLKTVKKKEFTLEEESNEHEVNIFQNELSTRQRK